MEKPLETQSVLDRIDLGDKEIELIEPVVIVALGSTAARALLGNDFRVSRQRGEFVESELAPFVTPTVHPSSVLRQETSQDRHREMHLLIGDLRKVERTQNGANPQAEPE